MESNNQLMKTMGSVRYLILLCYYSSIVLSQTADQLLLLQKSFSEDNCDFYNVLESVIPCGADGYVDSFAKKYCSEFLNQRNKFQNIEWNNGVHLCLEQTMLNNLRSSPGATCSQIHDCGFDSHGDCYLKPIANSPQVSFCKLSASDIARIAWIVKGVVFKRESVVQFEQIVKFCFSDH